MPFLYVPGMPYFFSFVTGRATYGVRSLHFSPFYSSSDCRGFRLASFCNVLALFFDFLTPSLPDRTVILVLPCSCTACLVVICTSSYPYKLFFKKLLRTWSCISPVLFLSGEPTTLLIALSPLLWLSARCMLRSEVNRPATISWLQYSFSAPFLGID